MSQLQVTGEAKIRDIQGPVVANSGVVTALDGAASQYVRGDGTLADFPTSSGGGSSVSYYLNSSVSQGTIGGVAYRELSKEPIIGGGTDIAISANGYVASYITDANDPDVVIVPGGNFNCEFYFSVSNDTGNPTTYAELYKYDGTTFTLLGTSVGVPESINQGTVINPYYFAIPVATAALALTDRLAIRIYVNVDGRTVTLHTENGHLCQVVTTLSKGMVSLNNLTDQSQFITTGTSGTNFNIVSSGDTHTFNLPVASATNTGKLSSTDWSTFNGKVPYTGATGNVDLGDYSIKVNGILAYGASGSGGLIAFRQTGTLAGVATGSAYIGSVTAGQLSFYYGNNLFASILSNNSLTADRTFTLPDLSGTLALLEGSQTFSGSKTFSAATKLDGSLLLKDGATISTTSGYGALTFVKSSAQSSLYLTSDTGFTSALNFVNTNSYNYTFPASSGTIALTSDLSGYVTLATTQTISGLKTFTALATNNEAVGIKLTSGVVSTGGYLTLNAKVVGTLHSLFLAPDSTTNRAEFTFDNTALRTYALPNASGTIALLSGTQTFTGATTFSSDITVTGVRVGKGAGSLSGNTALGEFSLTANTTGNQNTGIGFGTLFTNTTGQQNTALGNVALTTNSTGNNNTAIGFSTLISNTTGSNNTVIGSSAGSSITTGSNNTIIGTYSGTPTLANNIVLADGAGNIRYQWNGTNNVFGNPISGTSATFSSSVTASSFISSSAGNANVFNSASATTGWVQIAMNNTSGSAILAIESSTAGTTTNGSLAYATILRNYTATALQFATNNIVRTTIDASGNVGIGTSSAPYLLTLSLPSGVNGEIIRMSRSAGSYAWSLGIDGATSHFNFYNNSSSSVANINLSTGAYTATSDERLKENILDSDNAIEKLLKIKVRKYDWKDTDIKEDYGFVAQELYDVLPQYVSKGDEDRNWGVAKAELVPMLVKAIQELKAEIDELKNK